MGVNTSNQLAIIDDPADFGYPPGLPVELAMREHPVADICAAYGLSKSDFDRMKVNPVFLEALQAAIDMLKTEGMSFRVKARVQAEALLKTSWDLIHESFENVPAHVKANLITNTIRVAGLDASYDQKAKASQGALANALQININLGGD